MKITKLQGGNVQVTCENKTERTFWNNIRNALSHAESTINSLKKENAILSQEISFLKLDKGRMDA